MRNPNKRRKPPDTPWSQWLRFIERAETHPLTKATAAAIALFSTWVLLETLGQIRADLADRVEEREARMQERLDRAWTRMRTRSFGDIGKGWAVNTIMAAGGDFGDLDLSCKANGDYDDAKRECIRLPVYRGLNMEGLRAPDYLDDGRPWFLFKDVTDALFIGGNFNGVDFNGVPRIDNSRFTASTFIASDWMINPATTRKLKIDRSDLSFAYLREPEKISVHFSNISGTVFFEAYSSDPRHAAWNWAWADYPPRVDVGTGLEVLPNIESVRLCDPSTRVRGRQSNNLVSPLGFLVKDDVTGLTPRAQNAPVGQACREITADEARSRYPSSYRFIWRR